VGWAAGARTVLASHCPSPPGLVESRIARVAGRQKQLNPVNREVLSKIAKSRKLAAKLKKMCITRISGWIMLTFMTFSASAG
jgi:hypothetical protein